MPVLCRLSYSSGWVRLAPMIEASRRPRHALLALVIAVSAACAGESSSDGGLAKGTLVIETDRGAVELAVEIAESPEEQARGVMGREGLPENGGMIFSNPEPLPVGFTMDGVSFPLSLAVWGPQGRILSIIDMEPCPQGGCPGYDPGAAWTGAVEVNQGFFEENGVEVGDRVRLTRE
jgi:uncharacterized membrane protein (UPF0127 family)